MKKVVYFRLGRQYDLPLQNKLHHIWVFIISTI